jgi:DNA-binding transcriptional ArsR family regulator
MGLYHPSRDELDLTTVLHALSDPQRLRIVQTLAEDPEPRPCGTFDLHITKSTMTHHFRILREAGIIEQCSEGTAKLNELRRDDLEARFPGLLNAVLSSAAVPA